jgi:hypothetical protein
MIAILYLYLAGLAGYESTGIYQCYSYTSKVMTRGECIALATIGSLVWPYVAYSQIKEKITDGIEEKE